MKSFRSYLTNLDRLKQSPSNLDTCQPTEPSARHQRLYRTLLATTFVAGAQLLAMMPASSNPVPTPSQPSPLVPTRIILNGSFEQPVVTNWTGSSSTTGSAVTNIAGGNIPESYNSPGLPVIWRTTERGTNSGGQYDYKNAIEVWRGNPGNIKSATTAGSQYAEINGSDNASLFQDICVLPSETVTWSLIHAARNGNESAPVKEPDPKNTMKVSITNIADWGSDKTPPTTKLYESGSLSTTYSQGWQAKTGSWNSTNPSITPLRFAFQAIEGSYVGSNHTTRNATFGNFIDDVKLNLSALIDFLPTTGGNVNLGTTKEGNPNLANPPYYYLSLRINGKMESAGSVKITLTGLNAGRHFTVGSVLKGGVTVTGLSATASGNVITLSIPAGTYDANVASNYIHIPIDFSDTTKQPNDNLTFTLSAPTGGGGSVADLSLGSTSCAGTTRLTVKTLLKDDDYLEKV